MKNTTQQPLKQKWTAPIRLKWVKKVCVFFQMKMSKQDEKQ